jgi:hypothetical protein
MPKKTLYIRDSDTPVWEAIEKLYGEKSMSELVTEALREKLGKGRDGFLHVLYSSPKQDQGQRAEQFAVMFGPVDSAGSMYPRYCYGIESLKMLLDQIGITKPAIAAILKDLSTQSSTAIRVTLTEDKIALIRQEMLVLRLRARPEKFTVIAPDSNSFGLSPNYGAMNEDEMRTLLAEKFKSAPAQVDSLIEQAKTHPGV